MKYFSILLLICIITACENDLDKKMANENMTTYGQILQGFLNAESFQEYFISAKARGADQIIVADDEIRGNNIEPKVMKFGKPVKFIEKGIADTSNIGPYYWVIDFVVVDSTARMQVFDPTRQLLLSASFDLVDGNWLIHSADVQKE